MKAPNFELLDQNGQKHKLKDYKGKWLVIYFYPRDNTPGCTIEACSFRDYNEKMIEEDIKIIGISKDTLKSHNNFASKFKLNFPILSDEKTDVIKAYGALGIKKMFGKEYTGTLRKTFIINPKGEIIKVYEKVKPLNHAKEVFDYILSIKD